MCLIARWAIATCPIVLCANEGFSRKRVVRMEVGESDHHPLVVFLEGKGGRAKGRGWGSKERRGGRWTIRGGEKIRGEVDWELMRDKGVDEELEMKIGKIGEKLKEGERESGRRKRVG